MTKSKKLTKPEAVSTAGKKGGRPSALTPTVIAKLEDAYICGATHQQACAYAGIHPSSLYRHMEKNPAFRERIGGLKGMLILRAKIVIYQALEAGDLETSWKVLERGKVEGYQKVSALGSPGVQVNVQNNLSPTETPEGQWAIKVLHAIFSGKALPLD